MTFWTAITEVHFIWYIMYLKDIYENNVNPPGVPAMFVDVLDIIDHVMRYPH